MIELDRVSKSFEDDAGGEIPAVADVSLRVGAGETLALIGTSGSGKTTILKMINRLVEPTAGSVRLDGDDVRDSDPVRLRRGVGYVVQRGGLFPHLTVARNVGLLAELEGWARPDVERRVAELLELVNLPPATYADRRPSSLSGGERQRVGVARALVLDPPIVLLDEPFGALDPITRGQLQQEFQDLKRRLGKTVVIVTHDMAEAFALADRTALLDSGRLLQVGSEADFRERPANDFVAGFLTEHFRSAT